jgi:two-component system, OmpR family, response regulator
MYFAQFGNRWSSLKRPFGHGAWATDVDTVQRRQAAHRPDLTSVFADGYALIPFSGLGDAKGEVGIHHPAIVSGGSIVHGNQVADAEGNPEFIATGSHSDQRPPVLLISNDLSARRYLGGIVTQAGYHVVEAATAEEALRLLHRLGRFDLVLIHSIPDMRRPELCKEVRVQLGKSPATSVLVVSEQFNADEAVQSLMSGASDYISGPHLSDERVLLARLHVALRSYHLPGQSPQNESETLRVANIVINPTTHRVTIDGNDNDCHLTPIQFKILYRLAHRPGRVFLHEELRQAIAEFGGNPDDRTVKSHVSHLRKKLGGAGKHIKTVRGVGYKLEAK